MLDRLLDVVVRFRARLSRSFSPLGQRLILAVAASVFIVGGIAAARRLDVDLRSLNWGWILAAVALGVPLSALFNAAEYAVCSKLLLGKHGVRESLRVSVLGTAANLLPLPGAALVRIQALSRGGASYRRAVAAVTAIGGAWIGVSALLAGASLGMGGDALALPFLLVGSLALSGCYMLLRRLAHTSRAARTFALVTLAVEVGLVSTYALMLGLVLRGLHVPVQSGQAIVLALSGSLASAAGIFPGGLGIREVIAAVLAPMVGLPASVGFLASAVNYVAMLLAYSPLTAALAVGKSNGASLRATETDTETDPADISDVGPD